MECEEFKTTYGLQHIWCCDSCHEDDAERYGDDLWFDIDGREWNICCALANKYEELQTK